MPSRTPPVLQAAALLAIVIAGTLLRLIPWFIDPQGAFLSDAAFHIRMVGDAISRGVPRVDVLCDAPYGRDLARWLPLGWYGVVAFVHRVLVALGHPDPRENALFAQALAGGLIALPVAFATRALTRHAGAALAAALVAVILPAHLHRTWCYWFRYEAIGSLAIATHLAFGVAALAESRPRARRAWAALAGLALVASLDVWRVAFMVPVLETGFAAVALLVAAPSVRLRDWYLGVVAGGTLASVAIGYLRSQAFILSPVWMVAMALAVVLVLPFTARAARPGRALALAGAVALAVVIGFLAPHARQYGNVVGATFGKLGAAGGLEPMARVAMSIEELAGSGWNDLFGAGGLSWLAAALLPVLIVAWSGRPAAARSPDTRLPEAFVAWLGVTLFAITVLFSRNKVVLAPVVAIAVGWMVAALVRAPRPGRATGFALAALALATLGTVFDAVQLARTRTARLDADLYAALQWITDTTPPDAIVLSTWERGYEIQTWAGRRTLVDGLLEDDRVQERVPAIAAALLQPDAGVLAALCRREGAHYVLMPPSTFLLALLRSAPNAMQPALASTEAKVAAAQPLSRDEARPIAIGMMVLGSSPPPFTLAFERGGWRVYALPEAR